MNGEENKNINNGNELQSQVLSEQKKLNNINENNYSQNISNVDNKIVDYNYDSKTIIKDVPIAISKKINVIQNIIKILLIIICIILYESVKNFV